LMGHNQQFGPKLKIDYIHKRLCWYHCLAS